MPGVRDLLARFRPAGAPGAATAAGVPVDRGAGLSDELAPVFAALAGTRQECRRIRQDAEAAVARTATAADQRARAVLARAGADAAAERAQAQAHTRAQGAAAVASIAREAAHEVEDVRRRAESLIPALAGRLAERVRVAVAEAAAGGASDG